VAANPIDPRLLDLITRQQAAGYPGLAGSQLHATIRISAELMNEAIAGFIAAHQPLPVRELAVAPHVGNRIDVRVDPAMAFIPTMTLTLVIDRQPQLPADPVLVWRLTGGAAMLRFVAPAIAGFLPPGIRLEGERLLVDVRALLQPHDPARLLELAREIEIATLDGALVLFVHAAVAT
jgi:hypothetical protein